ncbi:hypothetical protein LR48_Vigan01g119200 [Vigna angularis]|uniref:Uncharacterized protein n=1 Tax=Phaseolus angularis TaxID=3914 RepID=A0A0L9TMH1_PHAAN|nr:hypothetical protein LR48_Vigan01g119200 [Vigna angularis]
MKPMPKGTYELGSKQNRCISGVYAPVGFLTELNHLRSSSSQRELQKPASYRNPGCHLHLLPSPVTAVYRRRLLLSVWSPPPSALVFPPLCFDLRCVSVLGGCCVCLYFHLRRWCFHFSRGFQSRRACCHAPRTVSVVGNVAETDLI